MRLASNLLASLPVTASSCRPALLTSADIPREEKQGGNWQPWPWDIPRAQLRARGGRPDPPPWLWAAALTYTSASRVLFPLRDLRRVSELLWGPQSPPLPVTPISTDKRMWPCYVSCLTVMTAHPGVSRLFRRPASQVIKTSWGLQGLSILVTSLASALKRLTWVPTATLGLCGDACRMNADGTALGVGGISAGPRGNRGSKAFPASGRGSKA